MISKEEIVDKIRELMKELSESFEHISDSENDVHPLEFQLFEANATYFTEHATILRKLEEEDYENNRVKRTDNASEAPAQEENNPEEQEQAKEEKEVEKENSSIDTPGAPDSGDPEISKTEEIFFTPPIEERVAEKESDSQKTVEEIPSGNQEDEPAKEQAEEDKEESSEKETVSEVDEKPSANENQSKENQSKENKSNDNEADSKLKSFFEPFDVPEELVEQANSDVDDKSENLVAAKKESVREEEVEPAVDKSPEIEEERPSEHEGGSAEKAVRTDDGKITSEVVIEEKTVSVEPERPMSLNERLFAQRKSASAGGEQNVPLTPPVYTPSPGISKSQRIRDIKSGINLNDKLLFIKDLFNGYSLAYSEAIELLNRFETMEDADRFLQTNYAVKNNWEAKKGTVEKLYAILRKRYG